MFLYRIAWMLFCQCHEVEYNEVERVLFWLMVISMLCIHTFIFKPTCALTLTIQAQKGLSLYSTSWTVISVEAQ
jgi:hypothetical protein